MDYIYLEHPTKAGPAKGNTKEWLDMHLADGWTVVKKKEPEKPKRSYTKK